MNTPGPLLLAAVDPSQVKTGWIGMITFLLLIAATYLLLRSFRNQMRKVDKANLPHEEHRPHGPRPALRLPLSTDVRAVDDAGAGRPDGDGTPGSSGGDSDRA